jgi:hypothetical protein
MLLEPSQRVCAAHHESGHAITARVLGIKFAYLSIVPDGTDRLGHTHYPPQPPHPCRAHAILSLAGIAAESHLLRRPISSALLLLDGGREDLLAACCALEQLPAPHRPTLWEMFERSAELIAAHWGEVQLIARALLATPEGRLTADEVDRRIAEERARTWLAPRFDDWPTAAAGRAATT